MHPQRSIRRLALGLLIASQALPIAAPFGVSLWANPFTGTAAAPATLAPSSGPESGTASPEETDSSPIQAHPVRASAADPAVIAAQSALHRRLGELMNAWSDTSNPAIAWAAVAAAFLYGILHAVGPGHRKTIVFSLYLAREAPVWEPAVTGLLLAFIHGGTSILILLAVRGMSGSVSSRAGGITAWMEGIAYLVLVAVALFLSLGAVRSLVTGRHVHGRGKASLGTIILTGAYPCPGAILVLVLAVSLGSIGLGILAVLAMSAGMGIPIVAAAYLAWFGRSGIFFALKRNEALVARLSAAVELAGYLVLLGFSFYIAQPFLASLSRQLAR